MSNTGTSSKIERLPPEVLDKIVAYLAPDPRRLSQSQALFNQPPIGWQRTLKSFRQSCSFFSKLKSVSVILFHDITFFTVIQHLERMEELSRHPKISKCVQRVYIHPPLLIAKNISLSSFRGTLEAGFRRRFRARLQKSELPGDQLDACVQVLVDKHLPYNDEQIQEAHASYVHHGSEQSEQLKNGTFVERWAHVLSKLTSIHTVWLSTWSEKRGLHEISFPGSERPQYLKRFYPDFLLQSPPEQNRGDSEDVDSFERHVLRAMSLARVMPERLALLGTQVVGSECNWESLPGWFSLDLGKLRSFDLGISVVEDEDSGLRHFLGPILARTSALEELHVRSLISWDDPCALWGVHHGQTTNLRQLDIWGIMFEVGAFTRLLQSNKCLEEIELDTVWVQNNRWRPIFDCMRHHRTLNRFIFNHLWSGSRLRFGGDQREVPAENALIAYLTRKGLWTQELFKMWEK